MHVNNVPHIYGQFRTTAWPSMHVLGLWEQSRGGTLGRNPCRHRKTSTANSTERLQPRLESGTFFLWGDSANYGTAVLNALMASWMTSSLKVHKWNSNWTSLKSCSLKQGGIKKTSHCLLAKNKKRFELGLESLTNWSQVWVHPVPAAQEADDL